VRAKGRTAVEVEGAGDVGGQRRQLALGIGDAIPGDPSTTA